MNGNAMQANVDFSPDVQQMLQGISQHGMSTADDSTRTAQAALATPMQASTYPEPSSYQATPGMQHGYDDTPAGSGAAQFMESHGQGSGNKPQVGSTEWHKQRKDNHKEGEC
jgi:transcriptional regulator CBF1